MWQMSVNARLQKDTCLMMIKLRWGSDIDNLLPFDPDFIPGGIRNHINREICASLERTESYMESLNVFSHATGDKYESPLW